MNLLPEDLRKLHSLELKILVEIKRICDKHKIEFMLIAGTLLGAIRHKGFIPWDDDIDIGMTRDNYEKFCKIAKSELYEEYFLQTPFTDNQYGKFFGAKIRLNGTKVRSKHDPKEFKNNGAYVDVFIFDNCPESFLLGFYNWVILHILNRVYCSRLGYSPKPKSIIAHFIMYLSFAFCFPISTNRLKLVLQNYHEKLNKLNGKYVFSLIPYSLKKARQLRSTVSEIIQVPFEGILMPVPKDYHQFLNIQFGDYMIPTSESKRRGHDYEINFGIYK